MDVASSLFSWYFVDGLGGIGGWLLFLMLGMAAVISLIIDSSNRRIPAFRWLLGAGLLLSLLLPSFIVRISSAASEFSPSVSTEITFSLGLVGGLFPMILGAGYLVLYWGMVGCENGHVYLSSLGTCPTCSSQKIGGASHVYDLDNEDTTQIPNMKTPQPKRVAASAGFLVDMSNNHRYDLLAGDTRVGRKASANDVVLSDPTVAREHILIREQNEHYTLYDRGSSSGTIVNHKKLRGSILLEDGDLIDLGDVTLKFVIPGRR